MFSPMLNSKVQHAVWVYDSSYYFFHRYVCQKNMILFILISQKGIWTFSRRAVDLCMVAHPNKMICSIAHSSIQTNGMPCVWNTALFYKEFSQGIQFSHNLMSKWIRKYKCIQIIDKLNDNLYTKNVWNRSMSLKFGRLNKQKQLFNLFE